MKIYTRKGDLGETSLLGGSRVPKHHLRIEAYGTVDELNSWIGLLRDQPISKDYISRLLEIQDRLFTLGAELAVDPQKKNVRTPTLTEEDILLLENSIDRMNDQLPEMKNFVLPGGHTIVSYCHISRCVCRRAERLVTRLSEESAVDGLIIKYLNRLSDYLFMLSRKLASELDAPEIPWKPRS